MTQFYGRFDHFSSTYETASFSMIKLGLDESDMIHANGHTYFANCGFHVNFWKFLMMMCCFMIRKDYFEQK